MAYQYAVGYNQAGSLADMTIQPAGTAIEYTFVVGGDGIAVPKGYGRQVLRFESVTAEQVETIITQLTLSYSTPSKAFTLRTTKNEAATGLNRDFHNVNAILTLPPRPRFQWFWKDFEIEVTRIEAI